MTSLVPPVGADVVPLLDPSHDPGNTTEQAHGTNGTSGDAGGKMKAVHYEGPFKVSVKEVEIPKIQHPDDVIVKVTTAGTKHHTGRLGRIADILF